MNRFEFYDLVYDFCLNEGYVDRLQDNLKKQKLDLIGFDDITNNGLDILDAVHCFLDKNRTLAFLEEIDLFVEPNKRVLEIGLGTGVLAFYAALKGGEVVGVEINKETFNFAMSLLKFLKEKKVLLESHSIQLFLKNIFDYRIDYNFNIIISENIYTGMFREKQVEILNYVKKNQSNDSCIIIPMKMDSYIGLVDVDYGDFISKPGEEIVPSQETGLIFPYNVISDVILYDSIDFLSDENLIKDGIDVKISFKKKNLQNPNSLLIYSNVIMPSGKVLKHNDVTFMNNMIFVRIDSDNTLGKNDDDDINLHIVYSYGEPTENAVFTFF